MVEHRSDAQLVAGSSSNTAETIAIGLLESLQHHQVATVDQTKWLIPEDAVPQKVG